MLQKAGGLFQLLAEVDFGTAFGIKALYLKSRATNPASAGVIRLGEADVINWRNNANTADLSLSIDDSDVLNFNGVGISVGGTPVQPEITVLDTATIDLTLSSDVLSADIKAGSIDNSMISNSAAIAYSKLNLSGSIVNADVSNSAAIAYSKLNLSGSIVNADVNSSAAIAYSKLNLSASVVNADISASAAIAFSKLASLTSGNILVGNGSNVPTSVVMSGDVTISNAGVTAIGNNKVTNAMLAQIATATFKGRTSASTGNVEDLTATQATALLNNFVGDSGSGGTKGLVPAPAAGDSAAGKFLKADGTWTAPSGAGDVVGPGSATDGGFARFDGTTGKLLKNSPATISNADVASNAAIAFSKLASLTAAHILVGNGSGVATDVAVSGDISMSNAGVTAYVGTVPLNKGGTGQATKSAAFDALSPMTTGGDLIYGGASGTGTRLANGSAGQFLVSAGSTNAPVWTAAQAYTATITGTMSLTSGSIADFTVSGLTNTAIQNLGWPTVSLASSSAGWTFTPTKIGIIRFAVTTRITPGANSNGQIVVTDGSNTPLSPTSITNFQGAGQIQTVTVVGFYNASSLSSVTLKIRGSITSGTLTVDSTTISMDY